MKFIKINGMLQAENGDKFQKESILQILTKASKTNNFIEALAVKAVDEDNLPYDTIKVPFTISSSLLEQVGYEVLPESKVERFLEKTSIDFGYPGYLIEDEDDGLQQSLNEIYAEADYTINPDGEVKKKSSLENRLTEDDDLISQDYSETVEGEDEPGITDNYIEDTKTKPYPYQGAIAKLKRIREKYVNRLTDNDDNTSINYSETVDGEGKVKKDTYKEDLGKKPWKNPNLGATSRKKRSGAWDYLDKFQKEKDKKEPDPNEKKVKKEPSQLQLIEKKLKSMSPGDILKGKDGKDYKFMDYGSGILLVGGKEGKDQYTYALKEVSENFDLDTTSEKKSRNENETPNDKYIVEIYEDEDAYLSDTKRIKKKIFRDSNSAWEFVNSFNPPKYARISDGDGDIISAGECGNIDW